MLWFRSLNWKHSFGLWSHAKYDVIVIVYVHVRATWLEMAVEGDLVQLLLRTLGEKESVDSYKLSVEIGKDHQLIVGAIKSLQSMGDVCSVMYNHFSLASQTQPDLERILDFFFVCVCVCVCYT